MPGKKIVIAEASSTIKGVADSLLRQQGYDVICTSDGLQAWEVIQAERPDMALIGLNLSGISGLELCRQMVGDRMAGGIPALLLVGANDKVAQDELLSSGAKGHIKKPFSPRELLDSVGKLIGGSGNSEAGESQQVPGSTRTNFKSELMSTTKHLENDSNQVHTLNWTDFEDTSGKNRETPKKVASIGSNDEDQGLIIEEDQFGLISREQPRVNSEKQEPEQSEDEDYEWFVGEMKKEVEGPGQDKVESKSEKSEQQFVPGFPGEHELTFEELGSGKQETPARADKADITDIGNSSVESGQDSKLSDSDMNKIAEKVAGILADSLLARLDKKAIIDAIKAAINK